jgi:replicative DNA helicase
MNDILDTAARIAYKDIADIKKRVGLPIPKSVKAVSIERMKEKELEKIAPKTGYAELDRIIKGFIPGHLYTLTGSENVGKTSISCNFAVRIAKQGKKVLYIALEPENTVVDYLASVRTGKEFDDLTEEDISYDDGNIKIFGKEDIRQLKQLIDVVEHSDRYDLIIIDHLGYFVGGSDVYSQQSDAIKKLAWLAKKKKCAVVMIAHLRKRPPGKKQVLPTSDDISGSGSFKQDSTEVMILTRTLKNPDDDSFEYSNDGVLYVTKTKCGPNGHINIKFNDKCANIESIENMMAIKQEAMNNYESKAINEVKPVNEDDWLNAYPDTI